MLSRFVTFSGAVAFVLVGAAARADDPAVPDLATLRANMRAAVGTPPANDVRTIAFTLDGLPGTRSVVRAGDDFVETTHYGPLTHARGSLAGQRWMQNDNGETILEQNDPGHAVRETYATVATRVHTPLDAILVETLNAKGYGTRDFVNPNTWLVVRRETVAASGTTVVTYDDFRSIGGYTTPFHWTASDGHPENSGEYRVVSDDTSPVPSAALAIPPARRAFVEFPLDTASVALPAFESHDQFIVRLDIGGHGYDFMLDTGASGIVIDDDVANALALPAYGAISNGVNAGRYVSRNVIASAVGIGDLRMRDVVMRTIPHLGAERPGDDYRVVGLLGFDFIDALSLRLDYQLGTVTATRSDAFAAPDASGTYALDVRLGTQQPMTDVRINGALGERFVLDTGAYGSLLIDDYFARRYPDALVDEGRGTAQGLRYAGVGGAFSTQPYQISSVQLGSDVRFKDFVVYRVTSSGSYGGSTDGLLGSELLKYFTVYTDYARGKVYLQTNDFGRAALDKAAPGAPAQPPSGAAPPTDLGAGKTR